MRQPDLQRLFIREEMDADPATVAAIPIAGPRRPARAPSRRARSPTSSTPRSCCSLLQATVVSGIVFPRDVKRLMGLDPDSPEYLEHMGEQLRRLVRRLK